MGEANGKRNARVSINSFFDDKPLVLNPDIKAGKIEDYVCLLYTSAFFILILMEILKLSVCVNCLIRIASCKINE